jgi:hypothetical protein
MSLMPSPPTMIFGAVEGMVDEVVLRRLIDEVDVPIGPIHGKNGKADLRKKIQGYNQAAERQRWVVLVDLDHERDCAPDLRAAWVPSPGKFLTFRVAVREIEAWLLADRERIAKFLGVAVAKVPRNPDSLDDPKMALVGLARHSRSRAIREDMVPDPKSGRSEGPAYASRISEFVTRHWRPSVAEKRSDSLRRCRRAIRRIVDDNAPPSPDRAA